MNKTNLNFMPVNMRILRLTLYEKFLPCRGFIVAIGNSIEEAASLLEGGKLVAIPTETVYGLAANGLRPESVTEIFRVKNRPFFNPLILHSDSIPKIESFISSFSAPMVLLAEKFWPGPMTLLLPRNSHVIHDLVTAGLPRVAVRIPDHAVTLSLLAQLDFPLAAPSANPFGYVSPTSAEHVAKQLGEKIPYILDGGPCKVGIESTILALGKNGKVVILRQGGLSAETIADTLGYYPETEKKSDRPEAPGMLKSHYAPSTRLVFGNLDMLLAQFPGKRIAILAFTKMRAGIPETNQKILSASGDMNEAARNLFHQLRDLDALDAEIILAETVPEKGLGRAINDRLKRAAADRAIA